MAKNLVSLFDAGLSDDELDDVVSRRVDVDTWRSEKARVVAVGTRRALRGDDVPRVSMRRGDRVRVST